MAQGFTQNLPIPLPVSKGGTGVTAINSATVATGDKVIFQDISDSDIIKYATAQSIRDLNPTLTLALSVYLAGVQTTTTTTSTKVLLDTETFDTNGNFTSSTFTPTVAGKYLVLGSIRYQAGTSGAAIFCFIYKNGASATQITNQPAATANLCAQSYAILDMNGSTDTIELYARQDSGSTQTLSAFASTTYLHAIRIS